MKIDLKGKKALVTGGSGGLGRTIAKTLAECGAEICVHYYSDAESAQNVVNEIRENNGCAEMFYADITDSESVNAMRNKIKDTFGMPDIIVVNAVIQYEMKSILTQDLKDYYSQFESCVMQMVHISKAFVPYLTEQNYGRIVIINTECSILADPNFSAYVAGKRGLDGIARVLAKEIGEYNITVNQIAPGWTVTDKERACGGYDSDSYNQTVPLRRRGTDSDIANLAAFLSSELAGFISGAFIPVAGGRAMTSI